jgi:uncharacterized membrane protein
VTSLRGALVTRVAFGASLVVLGAHALVTQAIVGVWGPVPRFVPAQSALPWLIGLIVVACGLGLVWRRTAPVAARVLLGWLLLWLLFARLVDALTAPAVEGYWSGCGETLVPAAAAWLLIARDGERGRVVARVLYGLALVPFGIAHFVYLKETASLVPAWLPAPNVWALATGGAYIAAASAMLTGVRARLAAVLSAVQIGAFTLLVWLPVLASGHADASSWSESVISLMLTAAACVIAQAMPPRS